MESTLATPSMARSRSPTIRACWRRLAGARSGFMARTKKSPLKVVACHSADVLDVVEDRRAQADGRAHGDVQQADGQVVRTRRRRTCRWAMRPSTRRNGYDTAAASQAMTPSISGTSSTKRR